MKDYMSLKRKIEGQWVFHKYEHGAPMSIVMYKNVATGAITQMVIDSTELIVGDVKDIEDFLSARKRISSQVFNGGHDGLRKLVNVKSTETRH